MKPYKRILLWSILLTVFIYLVDIYILDPIAPDPSWKYRITNFIECLILYGVGFFVVFSLIYICYNFVRKLVTK